jgi:hypothetical protein
MSASSFRKQSIPSAGGGTALPPTPPPPWAFDTSTNSWEELARAYTGTPARRSSISSTGSAAADAAADEEGDGMRAHVGGMGRGKGREERKEVRWVSMGRNGLWVLGLLGLGLGFEDDVEAGFFSHGKLKGMSEGRDEVFDLFFCGTRYLFFR